MIYTVYLVSAFGINKDGGNPAGVVLNADTLADTQKKEIARIVGYSETAFVQKSNKADFKVTFFTPTDEVDLCGHATVATYSLLFHKKIARPRVYSQEIKAGVLPIEIKEDGIIVMDQSLPSYAETVDIKDITDIFQIDETLITKTGLKPQIVSTGLRDIMLPIADRLALFELKPDFEKMNTFNKKTNTVGFHVFTLDTLNQESIAHSRNFAPLYGINEESATGSSNGALACYLFKYGKLDKLSDMKFEQGYSMNKPSEVVVTLTTKDTEITRVQVGGRGIVFGEREIEI